MSMEPSMRAKHHEQRRDEDIAKVAEILNGYDHRQPWEPVAEEIVDAMHPPYWRRP